MKPGVCLLGGMRNGIWPAKLRIEGLRERTEYIDIFLFFRRSLNRVLFPTFCLLVEGECQILVF